ncbi:MAG: hypothetical protein B6D40_04055 [Anaerolineae bacterium UTCFX3]|nr:MAG: hypothetical protein B6D40_04055 [Anaerolineae bacterium UTCFX3]
MNMKNPPAEGKAEASAAAAAGVGGFFGRHLHQFGQDAFQRLLNQERRDDDHEQADHDRQNG